MINPSDLGLLATAALPQFGVFLGRFHAVLLHFPIGVLGFVFLLELWAFWKPSRDLRRVIGLGLGTVTALGVAILGLLPQPRGASFAAFLQQVPEVLPKNPTSG